MRTTLLTLGVSAGLSLATGTTPHAQAPLHVPRNANLTSNTTSASRPNVVFILTDDQDLHLDSLDYQPLLKKHIRDHGTFFARHFCTIAICCPSRVSLWTGKAAHNTNVTDVSPPYGGYPKFISQGLNDDYLPVWLQDAGYKTYYTGKLFNAHTVENYNKPYPRGFNGSDFLIDPFTYQYLNSSFQRNQDPPVNHPNEYATDLLAEKAYGFLDDAVQADRPFFLTIAPVAPHANVAKGSDGKNKFTEPIPAKRHEHLFKDVKVPRTPNFNPENPSGVSWIKALPRQSQENVDYNDHFYRQRLRSLQAVDEIIEGVVERLDRYGILDNTYIIFTTDNGFHVGQHRMQPGKECGYEEDINIPLIIRGPGVPKNATTDIVTSHTDLAPTFLDLIGVAPRKEFDGLAIPVTGKGIAEAKNSRHEHVNVEFWGIVIEEGDYGNNRLPNNTYKALRIVGKDYNLYYSVWCNNEHELYDLNNDPYQIHNLYDSPASSSHGTNTTFLGLSHSSNTTLLGLPVTKAIARLDSLLFVLKSCKSETCIRPWEALHPDGNVQNLHDALSPRFDKFYEVEQERVSFSRCELGYIIDAEGPQFEKDGLFFREGNRWSDWV
ncbi:uncharacterized protein K452DRAFT_306619 [Aplosporella prunicola CBS 121167]|uniref:Arylsulfatase n=1 Tax=Aplosporella prunicola CBS 121167 TaxID=1176127 RepID=A0A6A6BKS0_9PEZI|nr:uncharacterized protein K452DRAFT_306619 [Aplosporella prunicola CBS 121167]KAF2143973.1 hypothetical protein K452DRAFT_306619 [Aplosporella prunicola CBS 121167]